MNIPNRASRNHVRAAARSAGIGSCADIACAAPAAANNAIARREEVMLPTRNGRFIWPGIYSPHPARSLYIRVPGLRLEARELFWCQQAACDPVAERVGGRFVHRHFSLQDTLGEI